jgi:hypothetical protein
VQSSIPSRGSENAALRSIRDKVLKRTSLSNPWFLFRWKQENGLLALNLHPADQRISGAGRHAHTYQRGAICFYLYF